MLPACPRMKWPLSFVRSGPVASSSSATSPMPNLTAKSRTRAPSVLGLSGAKRPSGVFFTFDAQKQPSGNDVDVAM